MKRRPTGIPAYLVTPGDDGPVITWGNVQSPDVLVTPQEAAEALRCHAFDECYIAITNSSADELRALWQQPTSTNYEKDWNYVYDPVAGADRSLGNGS